ncbi:diguanylate cyclase [Agrobacterium rhizogenes]|uniref:diguanylate cyclase n=1 Tax=Rhizobium rhizogenes TaxID=359 RepID=UPI001572A222|nr:diguanylate cyclase [Rhizobium rhizogenes]NTH14248.1 diguanylate cyclase [Rhizobium rhizogenes]
MTGQKRHTLASRALRLAALRIGAVCVCAGAVSYFFNHSALEQSVRTQLTLSTEQALQRESLPFREVKDLQRNYLAEFHRIYAIPEARHSLQRDFDAIFYRHEDGSYTQRPGLFEGEPLRDGRRFPDMSATYAPDVEPNDDVKARFALSYLLSYQYGSAAKGRLFNFYGVVPEKGFPIYQAADIAKVFRYEGPDALKLETYEFFSRGFGGNQTEAFFTRIYWDPSNNAWMTTIATPDEPDASGKHLIMACVDVLLDDLMKRTANPTLPGARATIFAADVEGTLVFDSKYADAITRSAGEASISSLGLADYRPLLDASRPLVPGAVSLVDSNNEITAVGRIPETPWVLAVHYPNSLMRPAILTNLAIVIAVGLLTLLVEIFILHSILQRQVAAPLVRLIQATQLVGRSGVTVANDALPTRSDDEIGELARDFASMAERVHAAHEALEERIQERTSELERVNEKLLTISLTDEMTGVANRRRFDEALARELKQVSHNGEMLMLAMVDVDWFKGYNDRYGHPAGDACLRKIAKILARNIRRKDDLVARYGGEEFAIVARVASSDSAFAMGQKLCSRIESAKIVHQGSPYGHATVSVGIALAADGENSSPETLLLDADRALYRAKQQGRNQVVLAEAASADLGSFQKASG